MAQPFELDGNATSGDYPGTDWDVVNGYPTLPVLPDDTNTSIAKTGLVIDRPEPSQAQFTTGGSKDESGIGDWKWSSMTPNDKTNITNAYAAAYIYNADFYLVFGIDRYDTSGDAQLGFWFLQDDVQPVQIGGQRVFSGEHKPGDLLVLVNFSNGGTVPTIEAFEWQGDDATGGPVHVAGGAAIECSGGFIPAGQDYCGITNAGNVDSPWPYDNKDVGPTTQFPPGAFFEGAINLTQAIGTTACFTNFLAESRTSTSIDAILKDFATPADGFNVCSVDVTKSCTSPILNATEDAIIYDITGQIINNGYGTIYNIGVTDSPAFDSGTLEYDADGDFSSGSYTTAPASLAGGASVYYSATMTVPLGQNGTMDTVTATANTESDGSGVALSDTAMATCPQLQISPELSITKACSTSIAVVNNAAVVAQVSVSGQVCNIGDTMITNVAVTDDKMGGDTNPLLSGVTLYAPADIENPTVEEGACANYTGNYTPTVANDLNDQGTTNPGDVWFKDTATASGVDIFGQSVTPQQVQAQCPLCPTCPDCP